MLLQCTRIACPPVHVVCMQVYKGVQDDCREVAVRCCLFDPSAISAHQFWEEFKHLADLCGPSPISQAFMHTWHMMSLHALRYTFEVMLADKHPVLHIIHVIEMLGHRQ